MPSRSRIACAVLCIGLAIPLVAHAVTRPQHAGGAEIQRRMEAVKQIARGKLSPLEIAKATRAEASARAGVRQVEPSLGGASLLTSLTGTVTPSAPTSSSSGAGSTEIVTQTFDTDGDGTVDSRTVTAATRDAQGRIVRVARAFYEGATVTSRVLMLNTYDAQGRRIEHVEDTDSGDDGIVDRRYTETHAYDQIGRTVSLVQWTEEPAGTLVERDVTTATFDKDVQTIEFEHDGDGDGTVDDLFTEVRTMDAQGRPVDQVNTSDLGADGTLDAESHQTFAYDDRGNLVELVNEFEAGAYKNTTVQAWVFDSRSNAVSFTGENDDQSNGTIDHRTTVESTYDARGNLVHEEYLSEDFAPIAQSMSTITDHTYDDQGRLIHTVTSTDYSGPQPDAVSVADFTYDSRGNQLGAVHEDDYDDDGNPDFRSVTTSEYDTQGNRTRFAAATDFDGDGVVDHELTEVSTFDPRGNLLQFVSERDLDGDGTIDYRTVTTIQYQRGMDEPVVLEGTTSTGPMLRAAAPNPFQDGSSLGFSLPVEGDVELTIFDASGRVVRSLVSGRVAAGDHQVAWDGRDGDGRPVANGAYFARLRAAGKVTTRALFRLR